MDQFDGALMWLLGRDCIASYVDHGTHIEFTIDPDTDSETITEFMHTLTHLDPDVTITEHTVTDDGNHHYIADVPKPLS